MKKDMNIFIFEMRKIKLKNIWTHSSFLSENLFFYSLNLDYDIRTMGQSGINLKKRSFWKMWWRYYNRRNTHELWFQKYARKYEDQFYFSETYMQCDDS